jgi:phosphatidylglycerol:prolipoprotein diacylglycerol transferase
LIVARLWNVFQFWPIYREEPFLILSIRPSGFVVWPGVVSALAAGYLYLLRRALDPVRVSAALAVGGLAAAGIFAVSAYLTGAVVGLPAPDLPWAQPYFGELRHPAALYMALGFLLAFIAVSLRSDLQRPARTILLAALGYSLVRLIADGFRDGGEAIAGLRISQIVALVVALVLTAALARQPAPDDPPADSPANPSTAEN